MKKIYLLLLATVLLLPAGYAQKGLSLGLNGSVISPTIINQNTWGVGHEYEYEVAFSSSYGFDIGYNFTDGVGLYSGFWFTNMGQKYKDTYDGSDWKRELQLKYNLIPVMVKYTGSTERVNFVGGIGILYAMLKEANQTWTRDGQDWNNEANAGAKDVTKRFSNSDIILNFEVGARIMIIHNLYVDLTINGGYGLKDINATDWQTEDTNGKYEASHNAYGGFKIGVAYVLFGEK